MVACQAETASRDIIKELLAHIDTDVNAVDNVSGISGVIMLGKCWAKVVNKQTYCKTSNISHTLVCYKIVDNSDVVGASPVGAASTTSLYLT